MQEAASQITEVSSTLVLPSTKSIELTKPTSPIADMPRTSQRTDRTPRRIPYERLRTSTIMNPTTAGRKNAELSGSGEAGSADKYIRIRNDARKSAALITTTLGQSSSGSATRPLGDLYGDRVATVVSCRITDTELSRRVRSKGFVEDIRLRRQVTRADLSGRQPGIGVAKTTPNSIDALSIFSELLYGVDRDLLNAKGRFGYHSQGLFDRALFSAGSSPDQDSILKHIDGRRKREEGRIEKNSAERTNSAPRS